MTIYCTDTFMQLKIETEESGKIYETNFTIATKSFDGVVGTKVGYVTEFYGANPNL